MKQILIYLYVNNNCIYCKALEQYLVINNLNFVKININEAPNKIKKFLCVPIIKINSKIIKGFDLDSINKELNINLNIKQSSYLDNAATTKLKSEVFTAMKPYMINKFANPSSIYSLGLDNKEIINKSRNNIAKILKCSNNEVIFTSGGSESNNTVIKGVAFANKFKGNHIITTSIEHSSVLNACKYLETKGFKITYLPVDKNGKISITQLEKSITSKTILISVMFVNNEIGTIQEISKIGDIAKKNNILFHTDAVQAFGKVYINLNKLNIDLLSLSAHKFHGPKGIGLLYIKQGTKIDPLIHGGSQENHMRAGTENISCIVGLEKALALATYKINLKNKHIKSLENRFITKLLEHKLNFTLNVNSSNRIAGCISIKFNNLSYTDNTILKFLLDINKIYVSSNSACNENSNTLSHVLSNIGLDEKDINRTIRITLSDTTTEREIDYAVFKISDIINNLNNYYKNLKLQVASK